MTAAQICLRASQMGAGGTGMVAQAGQFLNLVLAELVNVRNLKINRVTQIITPTTGTYGPFALEADYLRTYDMFFPIPLSGSNASSGQPQFLDQITMEQWDAEFKDQSTTNYPYEFATDISTQAQVWNPGPAGNGVMTSAGQLFIYPQAVSGIVITHRYMVNQPDIVTPETSTQIPWFPHQQYLLLATAAMMCDYTRDDKGPEFLQKAEGLLKPYLIMEGDEQQTVRAVRLDPRKFHFHRGLKPTKSDPF